MLSGEGLVFGAMIGLRFKKGFLPGTLRINEMEGLVSRSLNNRIQKNKKWQAYGQQEKLNHLIALWPFG